MLGGDYETKAVGEYTYTSVVIAGQTITVNVSIKAKPLGPVTNYTGDAATDFGTGTTARFLFRNEGTATDNGRPGGTFDFPAVGSTYTDAFFGTPSIRRITGANVQMLYTSRSLISLDNTYIISDIGAATGIYALDGTGKIYNHPEPGTGYCQFSRTVAGRIYCYGEAATVRQYHLGTAPAIVSDGTIWTSPGSADVTDGYENFIQADDWIAFITTDATKLYAVNLASPSTAASLDLTTISPVIDGTIANSKIDYVFGPFLDSNTGRRYIEIAIGSGQSYVAARQFYFDTGETTITYAGMGPPRTENASSSNAQYCNTITAATPNSNCVVGNHSSAVWSDGVPALVSFFESGGNGAVTDVPYVAGFRFNAGLNNMALAKVQGGGLSYISNLVTYSAGATNAPYVAITSGSDPTVAGYLVTAATGSSPVTVTLSPDPGWAMGQAVLFSGAAGMTGLDGVLTIASSLGGAQYTISVATSGTYTANSAGVTANTATSLNYQEIQTARWSNTFGAIQVNRDLQHRSVCYTNINTYDCYPRLSISPDGSKICFQSNGGLPYKSESVYCYTNWMTATLDNELSIAGRTVAVGTTGSVSVLANTAATVTITYGTNPDLATGVSTITCAGAAYPTTRTCDPMTVSPGTTYYWRAKEPGAFSGDHYVAVGTFTSTLASSSPTFTGNARLSGKIQ